MAFKSCPSIRKSIYFSYTFFFSPLIVFPKIYNMSYPLIFLFSLLVLVNSQQLPIDDSLLDDPDLKKIISNYFGCKIWENGLCIQCSDSYYFNDQGVCCQISPHCQLFNKEVGKCESCYLGYKLEDGQCLIIQMDQSDNVGCKAWVLNSETGNHECLECSERYYLNGVSGVCEEIDVFCQIFDFEKEQCIQCYKGYHYDEESEKCLMSQLEEVDDPGCKVWDFSNQICLECSYRWVMDQDKCLPVNDFCKNWEQKGECTECYRGYHLSNGECLKSPKIEVADVGCRIWDWENQKCLQCSHRWVLYNGRCTAVDDYCSSFNKDGECTGCYKGYNLREGKCKLNNSFCKSINETGQCKSCFVNSVLYKKSCVRLLSLADLMLYYKQRTAEEAERLIDDGIIKTV